jgi:hypothetical protein
VDAPAEGLARAESVGSNICVSICCLMWGRTFVDSWLVFPAPLEVRGSARKGVQLFWPTVSSWARGKGTLYIRVAGGHLCSLLTRPLGTPPPRTLLINAFSSRLSCLLVAQTPPCRNGAAVSRAVLVRAACKCPRCPPCRHRRSPRYPTCKFPVP